MADPFKTSQVWIKGNFIGGCNDGGMGGVVPLLKSGKIQEIMAEAACGLFQCSNLLNTQN